MANVVESFTNGDEVLCLPVNGKPVILGKPNPTGGLYTQSLVGAIIPFTARASGSTASTTSITDYTDLSTTTITMPAGTYTAHAMLAFPLQRSVNTGDVFGRILINGQEILTSTWLNNLVLPADTWFTLPGADSTSFTTDGTTTLTLQFRGGATAGTTRCRNPAVHGVFVRTS